MIDLNIEKLHYSIGDKSILKDVSLSNKDASILGIIGPNGSGKTTLLKHIYRAIPPEKETVFVGGKDICSLSYKDTAKMISVLRQESSQEFEYTVLDMVLLGRSPYLKYYEGYSKNDIEIAQMALDSVGMKMYETRSYQTLSGGEKQRVLLARSITQQSDILLLDEPTNHLDVHYQWKIMDLLVRLNKKTISVFHELNIACAYCDQLIVLHKGEIVNMGLPADIITIDLLRRVFRIEADLIKRDQCSVHIVINGAA